MKKKCLLPILLVSGVLSLSSCTFFNDDDLAINNEYHPLNDYGQAEPDDPNAPKAGGVSGKVNDATPDAYCFKNIPYGVNDQVINTYKEGGINHMNYNVNGGLDYPASKDENNYDLYVPNSASKTGKHVAILFIHGGAWVSGFKTDVNPYIYEFANRGYITATIKYTLLSRSMDDSSLSIFRNLDEIDACITSLKSSLQELGFDTTKTEFVIGGASSGAHLAMLYSYSRGKRASLPIKFIVDAVGPVDIKEENWKLFKTNEEACRDLGLDYEAIENQKQANNLGELPIAGEGKNWTDYQTMRIANGMCGLPFSLETVKEATDENENYVTNPSNPCYQSMIAPNGGEDQLSVTYWINKISDESAKFPIICAYAGKDSVIGIAQYAKLQQALDNKGIEYYHHSFSQGYIYFKNSEHTQLTKNYDEENYTELINAIVEWCDI